MTNQDRVLKSRDITLPTKVRTVKAMVSPVVVYRCERWTRKKAEKSESESCSIVSDSLQPHGLYIAHQAPLSMRFSRQGWSGLPFPSPGDLPNPGIESGSPALQADSLLTELQIDMYRC